MENFSERLFELMQRQRFNKSSLGKAVGVTHSTVARWLAGSIPAIDTLQLLAKTLGVSAQFLISGEERSDSVLQEEATPYRVTPSAPPPDPASYQDLLAKLIPALAPPELMETIETLNSKKPPGWETLSSQAIALLKQKLNPAPTP